MGHFIWDGYFPGSGHAFAESQQGLGSDQAMQVLVGEKVAEPLPKVRITQLSDGELPDLLESAWSSRIVSAKLKKVLEKICPNCVQYIPVKLDEYPDAQYWIANVLKTVSSLDRDKSEVTAFPKRPQAIQKVKKLVLKPIPEDAPAVFHMEELPPVLLVSEALRKELEAASSSAGRFTKPEDYRRPAKY